MKSCLWNRFLDLTILFLFVILTGFTPLSLTASAESAKAVSSVPVYNFKILNIYPHDQNAFTQGLFFEEGFLYEGTGLNGQSALRKINLKTGDILKIHKLPQEFFGEGIVLYNDKIIQLTWKSHVGFVYDKNSFKLLGTFFYPTEGWGITYDGKQLIMSDGTANLYFLNPETLKVTRRIEVRDQNIPVTKLNELEYVRGEIFANIWLTNRIARIDPQSGRVTGWIDLEGLSPFKNSDNQMKALNGIAYDSNNRRLFVTGKLWPELYEIKLIPAKRSWKDK
jgi:glutaminyl-peptide cyclotransferase